jgi:hypothetical protein
MLGSNLKRRRPDREGSAECEPAPQPANLIPLPPSLHSTVDTPRLPYENSYIAPAQLIRSYNSFDNLAGDPEHSSVYSSQFPLDLTNNHMIAPTPDSPQLTFVPFLDMTRIAIPEDSYNNANYTHSRARVPAIPSETENTAGLDLMLWPAHLDTTEQASSVLNKYVVIPTTAIVK